MPTVTPDILIDRGNPENYYQQQARFLPDTPTTPNGLSILSGNIAKEALKDNLATNDIPTSLTEYTTIETLAHELADAARDTDTTILSKSKRQRAIRSIFTDAQNASSPVSPELTEAASRLPWETSDVLEQFDAEYIEWTRATAAGDDHDTLEDVIDLARQENPHAAEKTTQYTTAFEQLDEHLHIRTDADTYVTRNHMVRDAAATLDETWSACFEHID